MAKKTLSDILKCPVDFIYLWASDAFISQLGSKANIIRQKKYNQYQTLWKTVVDNTKNSDNYTTEYNSWVKQIGSAIEDVYGMTPATILKKLAMGEQVLGKNWDQGVYGGIGRTKVSFDQAPNVTVDANTGKILRDGVELPGQTAIYGADGTVGGYSCLTGDVQFQSAMGTEGYFGSYSYSKGNGTIQTPNGDAFDSTKGSFWQNAENYMPIVDNVLNWLMSLVDSQLANRTVLTPANTVPKQTEWVENDSNNTALIAGGVALAALALVTMDDPRKKGK